MLHFYQIYKLLDTERRELMVHLFDDLSFELEDMGWSADPEALISDLFENHLGIELLDEKQLKRVTKYILENQGKLVRQMKNSSVLLGA